MAGDPVDSLLMSLVEKEIPDGRNALIESHNNLAELSAYCKENYINSPDKSKALQETKEFASQSLASVAYQIHSLAVNILQMMDQQTIQLQNMQSNANNIGLLVDIHKEKVARREIGTLTSSKNFSRAHKVVPPEQPEKVKKYKREEIDYSSLDDIGHGVKGERKEDTPSERRSSQSSSSGSLKENNSSASVHSSSAGSIHGLSGSSIYTSLDKGKGAFATNVPPPHRPPVAPVAPFKVKATPVPTPAPVVPTSQVELPPPSTPMLDEPPPFEDDTYDVIPPPPTILQETDTVDADTKNIPPPPPPPPGPEDLYQVPPNNMPAAIDVDEELPPMPTANVDDLPPPPPDNLYDDDGNADDANNVYDSIPPPSAMPPPPPPMDVPEKYEEKVVAIYDYQKLRDDELELMEGDVIYVIKKNEDGWFEGIKDGVQGLFPGNYVTSYM